MNAKEYLSQARCIKMRLETMREQLAFLKSASEYSGPMYNDMPKTANRSIHKNEDAVIRVIEKQEQIKAVQLRLDEIIATIDCVKDPTRQAILVKRYLSNKTWDSIARELFISERHTRRMYWKAIAEVEEILKHDHECP